MLKVTPIKGGRDAINYYAGLVRREQDEGSWEAQKEEGQGHVEDYYLASSEEGGRWWGEGAQAFGLQGLGCREQLEALFAGKHPDTGEQLGQPPRDNTIRAYDLTFSAPKTVSLLASLCGGEIEGAVIDAHERAVAGALSLIEERTTTRGGRGGHIRLDIGGLAVLRVRHRTSRALDPQLHTHALVIARVQGTDGRWRSLDATTMMRGVLAFGAIYQSVLRAELELRFPSIAFGEVVKGQADIAGLDELKDAFSKRSRQIEKRFAQLIAEWRERHPHRNPTIKEECLLRDQAAVQSRAKKQHARALEELRTGWLGAARELGYDPMRIKREVLFSQREQTPRAINADDVACEAIAALSQERSVFAREHVEREVAMRVDGLADMSGAALEGRERVIEALAQDAIESLCIDLAASGADGAMRAAALAREPALERYTTPALLEEEQGLVRWMTEAAAEGGGRAGEARMARALATLMRDDPNALAPEPEQIEAAALIAGTHRACTVVGPAGAGKTTALKLAARALREERRQVVVLAPWAKAAEAARRSSGLPAENVRRFLIEQGRAGAPTEHHVSAGTTLIVDEAGTLPTPDWRALVTLAERERLRLVFVGDHRQLAPVGRGGMFEAARSELANAELARVYRFNARWERRASLVLRSGSGEALREYERHGRIFAGAVDEVQERILSDWQVAHRSGRSYAFSVPTREQEDNLSRLAQERLIEAGELDVADRIENAREQSIHVGDRVQTRRNERRPEIIGGGHVRNREVWTVRAIAEDGSLTLQRGRAGRTVTASASYAREHVELAYFSTVHAVQGETVIRGGTLVDELAGFRSVYVGLTRGRAHNVAYVVSDDERSGRDVLERALLRDRADLGVLAQARSLSELATRQPATRRYERNDRTLENAEPHPEPAVVPFGGPQVHDGRIAFGAEAHRSARLKPGPDRPLPGE